MSHLASMTKAEMKSCYNLIAPSYGATCRYTQMEKAMIIKKAEIRDGDRVVDMGCGDGMLLDLLKTQYGSTLSYTAVDISEKMIKATQDKFPGAGGIDLIAILGDICGPGLSNYFTEKRMTFDVIFCTMAFTHIPPNLQAAALTAWASFLTPGGRIICQYFMPGATTWAIVSSKGPIDEVWDVSHPDLLKECDNEFAKIYHSAGLQRTDQSFAGPAFPDSLKFSKALYVKNGKYVPWAQIGDIHNAFVPKLLNVAQGGGWETLPLPVKQVLGNQFSGKKGWSSQVALTGTYVVLKCGGSLSDDMVAAAKEKLKSRKKVGSGW